MSLLILIRRFAILFPALARLASCGGELALVPVEQVHEPVILARSAGEIRDVVMLGDGDYVAAAGGSKQWETRVLTRGGETLFSVPEEAPHVCAGEALLPRASGGWWYSRCGGAADGVAVRFASSRAPSQITVTSVPLAPRAVAGWLPLKGDDPAGVLLATDGTGSFDVHAHLVTPGSVTRLPSFAPRGWLGLEPALWRALRLPDGRIAIVSLELDDRDLNATVMLRIVSKSGEITETQLPFARDAEYAYLAAAVSQSGVVGISVVRMDGAVLSSSFDPDQPHDAAPRRLSSAEGARLPAPGVIVEAVGERFVVTWVGAADRALWLCEFAGAVSFPAVRIGEGADRFNPLLTAGHRGDAIDVVWAGSTGLTWRRLPQTPTGYVVAADLWTRLRALFVTGLTQVRK